jgi:hypothetical protein
MHRTVLMALSAVLTVAAVGAVSAAQFAGPGPGITGNDTGGIFPYSPDVEGIYQQIADGHCARWGRLAKVTSVHRTYGDYVSFVCYDRPGIIH